MSNIKAWISQWKKEGAPPLVPWKIVKETNPSFELLEIGSDIPTFSEFYEEHVRKDPMVTGMLPWNLHLYFKHAKPLWNLKLTQITKDDLISLKAKIGLQNKYVANQVLEMVRRSYRHARLIGIPLKDHLPAEGVKLYSEEEICDFTS